MRQSWTDESTMQKLREVTRALDYMPSANELRKMGHNDLAVQITRRFGMRGAELALGKPRKESCTIRGHRWERYIANRLRSAGYKAERQSTKAQFDILVGEDFRLNVKSARHRSYQMPRGGNCRGYFFGIAETHQHCDGFALVCDAGSGAANVLWVPASELRQQTLTLTPSHRVNAFADDCAMFDLIGAA